MLFRKKRASVIDRRIEELGKEMAKVQRELTTLARPEAASTAASPGRVGVSPFGLKEGEDDLFTRAARQEASASADAGGESVYPEIFEQTDGSRQSGRKRFANYFMAGHFQNLRPLRQESRIVRNKAIGMVVLVLAVVFWLIYYFRSH